eukprot:1777241-Alexandrium_andersonii.AAC.1
MGLLEVAPERPAHNRSNFKSDLNLNGYTDAKTDRRANILERDPPSSLHLRARSGVGRSGKPASAGVT